jgi:hypothetical protein
MLPTLKGRLQTKLITYAILALVTVVFSLTISPMYWWLFAIAVVVGLALETLWGLVVNYEPGWLTILFALIEFLAIANIMLLVSVPMPFMSGLMYYLVGWSVIQLVLIYLIPIFRLSWVENGNELW